MDKQYIVMNILKRSITMKINWKEVAASPGYIYYKSAYKRRVQNLEDTRRNYGHKIGKQKETLLREFNKKISIAINHAYHTGKTIIDILNEWARNTYFDKHKIRPKNKTKQYKIYQPKNKVGRLDTTKKSRWLDNKKLKADKHKHSIWLKQYNLEKRQKKK